jgi:hypothetical protein
MLIPPVQSRGGDLGLLARQGQAVLAGMRRAGGGNIVIIASEWGVIGRPEATASWRRSNAKVGLADMHEEYSRDIPIGRIGGTTRCRA